MAKRLFDILATLAALPVILPLGLLVAVLVWLRLGSPVILSQQRPGLRGKTFIIYKFRSMTDARDKAGNLLPDERRLSTFGLTLRRFSLDELPEFWNVLKGEMSLVGPRPLLMDYLGRYSPEQARRHAVLPGITGWAQVSGRNAITWEQKFAHDLWYVDNRSLWLDIQILIRTLRSALKGEGISAKGHATMPTFEGKRRRASATRVGPASNKRLARRRSRRP